MKHYINKEEFKKGDIIYFEMPPMCSGEYSEEVKEDEVGLYIENNWFQSSYDYRINKPYWA